MSIVFVIAIYFLVVLSIELGLAAKSLYFTISYVMLYTEKRKYLLAASEEIFSNVAKGVLRVRANRKYPLHKWVKPILISRIGKQPGLLS